MFASLFIFSFHTIHQQKKKSLLAGKIRFNFKMCPPMYLVFLDLSDVRLAFLSVGFLENLQANTPGSVTQQ
jgi:hypothetical protein